VVRSWASYTARPVTGLDARRRTGSNATASPQDRLRSGRGGCALKEQDHQPDEPLVSGSRMLGRSSAVACTVSGVLETHRPAIIEPERRPYTPRRNQPELERRDRNVAEDVLCQRHLLSMDWIGWLGTRGGCQVGSPEAGSCEPAGGLDVDARA
jgi:hypothetical protein